ncbi:hypothetical protein [Arthrobacter sp. SDTb3-6]|uniref:hypothetical protein n=1 Tax=Arthrobacter sp. SDTb3-6 TaxID=2713571 RepID=UPI00159DA928|nr:hypothetical protein [Arthrobacter sp. SDTb3-6]NVM97680.1 hypothetical protein [Arthrobacter sp. SDTb3-6]
MKTSPCPECTATKHTTRYTEDGPIYSIRITHQPDCTAYAARQATAKALADQ